MLFGKKNREQTFTISLGHGEQLHVIAKSLVERDLGLRKKYIEKLDDIQHRATRLASKLRKKGI